MDPAAVSFDQSERLIQALALDAAETAHGMAQLGIAEAAAGRAPTVGALLEATWTQAFEAGLDLQVREPVVAAALLEAIRAHVHAGRPAEEQAAVLDELAHTAAIYRRAYDDPDWRPE